MSSTTVHRTPKSAGRQSLFFHDLASPVSARRGAGTGGGSGKFSTPGQAAAVSALWRENFSSSDLPPPPIFTLDDRSDFSPEFGIPDLPLSPDPGSGHSNPRTPVSAKGGFSGGGGFGGTYSDLKAKEKSPAVGNLSWWSEKSGGGGGGESTSPRGSPVEGVVKPMSLITVPPPREVARPEVTTRNSAPIGWSDDEEWVTVYGFFPGDTNLVLREFEKCGVILKHVPGPGDANWMHILFQSRSDAQRALSKNGMQINGALIVGVKPIDPLQRQVLKERPIPQGFMTLPPSRSSEPTPFQPFASNVRHSGATFATPEKSIVSKIMDAVFGL